MCNINSDPGSPTWFRQDFEVSPYRAGTLAHITKSAPTLLEGVVGKAHAIVFHLKSDAVPPLAKGDDALVPVVKSRTSWMTEFRSWML